VTLMRFFNARNGKEADALKMLRDTMQWRSNVNMDKYLRQGPVLSPEKLDAIRRFHPQGCHKWDKEGNLLYIEPSGALDPEALLQFGSVQEAIDAHIQKWEFTQHFMFPQASQRAGRAVNKLTVIYDLDGIRASMFTKVVYQFLKEALSLNNDHYPDQLSRCFIVNTPLFFYGIWKIIRLFLNDITRDKVRILDRNYKPELLKFIDASNLPQWLGGACECFPGNPYGGCVSSKQFTKTHFWNDMDTWLASQTQTEQQQPSSEPPPPHDATMDNSILATKKHGVMTGTPIVSWDL